MDQTMLTLQSRFPKQQLEYFAAIHSDHTDKRHVHVVALLRGRLTKGHLRELRATATRQALSQRKELDREQGITQSQQRSAAVVQHREPRSIPVFVSRQPQRVDAPAPRVMSAGKLPNSAQQYQTASDRLEIVTPICPVCKSRNMVREGSRNRCVICGLSVEASRSLTAKLKARKFARELFLEEAA